MPKWAEQHRSHATTRQTAGWRGVDPILRLAQVPGYVVIGTSYSRTRSYGFTTVPCILNGTPGPAVPGPAGAHFLSVTLPSSRAQRVGVT
eukprot:1292856-Prymnesium_polylepis.1